jgi:O-antigen/teichoic acid export membrane protein
MKDYNHLHSRVLSFNFPTLKNKFFWWNVFGNIGPLFFALFSIPYIYGNSSKEYVGFLTLVWAAIGYSGLFDFGLSRALFYFTSISKSNPAIDIQGAIVKSALFALAVSGIMNAVLYLVREDIASTLLVNNGDQIYSLFIIAASLPIYLISNMIRSGLEGMELFKEANIYKFVSYLSLFLCPALFIAMGDKSLARVCILYSIVRLLACVYAWLMLLPHLRDRQGSREGRTAVPMRKVLGFGGWATVSSTISPLMVYGDRFAIAYFSGASAIAIYALLQELIGKTILLSASYVTAIQPKLSYLPEKEAAKLYARESRNVARLSILIYGGCLVISPFFVSHWLSVSIGEVAFLAIIMSIGFMFNSMAQAPLAYLLARGNPRRVAYSHAVEMLLYFPALVGATVHYGLAGAATIGVLRQIFDYGILSWQARRQTG